MKKIVLSSIVVGLLVFSGCSSKEPAVDTQAVDNTPIEEVGTTATQEVEPVATETVSSDESAVNEATTDSTESRLNAVESKVPTIYFAFDKYNITPEMQEKIDAAAELGKNEGSDFKVKLEGNCDEWGSDEYNFALGLRRANAVKKALIADGIDASRISMVSYGKSNPVCTAHTKECWAKNRRVNFKVLP
ncbi:Outer membrane lipoprotein omp16 precursor [hydrothermal vent metagenome]|uniref:Outer membrane lipoprotein omp16 n=1 Tax=hydrothermal vent metagenome TaxID=652676 RepID=A0A1W1CJV5_9ZZZZ